MLEINSEASRLRGRIRRHGRRVLRTADLVSLSSGLGNGEPAIRRLEEAGVIARLDDDLWMVPSGRRAEFEMARARATPDLDDPLELSAIVLSKPTLRDVTRLLLAYCRNTVEGAFALVVAEGRAGAYRRAIARRMIDNAWKGIADAARDLASQDRAA